LRAPRRRQPASPSNDGPLPDESNPATANNDLTPLDSAETEPLPTEQIQILGLHTSNPIISYHNQVFTCSWADQIGTELVFSHPDPDADHHTAPLRTGDAFELLAANSVKILGRKGTLTSSSGERALESESTPRVLPRRGAVPTNQTQFLERLQNIKAARGETDTVRTVMSTRRNMNLGERLKGWARTEEQVAEIHRLNEKANAGDPRPRQPSRICGCSSISPNPGLSRTTHLKLSRQDLREENSISDFRLIWLNGSPFNGPRRIVP
jgi:hypothetical protein